MKFTYPDEILKEVWATKDRIGAKYKGNVHKFLEDLRKHQAASPLKTGTPAKSKSTAKTRRKSA